MCHFKVRINLELWLDSRIFRALVYMLVEQVRRIARFTFTDVTIHSFSEVVGFPGLRKSSAGEANQIVNNVPTMARYVALDYPFSPIGNYETLALLYVKFAEFAFVVTTTK